jgi:acyl carrier protein
MTASLSPAVEARATVLMQSLSSELRLPGHRLHGFTRLREDLFLDRMDIDLLVASLESRMSYYLTEEEAAQIETVGDLQHFFLR